MSLTIPFTLINKTTSLEKGDEGSKIWSLIYDHWYTLVEPPCLVTDLYNSVKENELDQAWEIYDKLLPLCNFLEGSGKYVQIAKRAMDLQGLAGGPPRKPRLPITGEEKKT